MKKCLISCILLIVMLVSVLGTSFAKDDISGLSISSEKWNDYGSKPSMLNFGYAKLALGENFYDANDRNECNNIKNSISTSQLSSLLDSGMDFYIYAKWQNSYDIPYYVLDADLIITSPTGDYYVVSDTWIMEDYKGRYHFSWFFDVTNKLEEIRSDNGGSFPQGTYDFSMFFNGYSFRTNSIKVK